MKNKRVLLCGLLVSALVIGAGADVQAKSKKKSKGESAVASKPVNKAEEAYNKLFKDKKCETKKGMFTLHKVDQSKLYFELPVSMLGREMLLGSTISEISNNGHGVIGYKPQDPMHVTFKKMGEGVHLCLVNTLYGADMNETGNEGIINAVKKSTIDGIYRSYKIEAYTPDSSALVIDVTNLFLEDNKDLTPFDPWGSYGGKAFKRNASFEKSKSHLDDIKAFDDNVTVKSYLSYSVDLSYTNGKVMAILESKRPFTALMTRTLMLLPDTEMRPRIADPRINIFIAPKAKFSANDNRGTLPVYYARHWRVEPSDLEAYKRGELVEPVKPITFYVDKNFPDAWKPAIKAGILEWNKAFEKIGFKNVMRAEDYPENDPEFDPDNIKYSCVRYAPISIMNAMGPSWDDPRTGEIINASVMVYHDITRLINNWRLLQTAAADPSVRSMNLPKPVMDDALRYVIAHEIGHCLGYMHNMSASAAIPVDSLRSPSFTQKYGTTYSIMDYARFNHVAQPGDAERGVKMTPPDMGVYDYFAVKWLYTPILSAKTAEEEVPTLDKWIGETVGNPIYRYGKQQPYNTIDPSSMAEDLGDDVVKGAEYGIKNLKYIVNHINEWVGEDDKDYEFREDIYYAVLNQYLRFILHAYNVKGGVYMNERKGGDKVPSYEFVDGDYQRRAQQFLVDQLYDLDWIDNNPLVAELSLKGYQSVKIQRLLANLIIADRGTLGSMIDPNPNAFTLQENHETAFKGIFKNTFAGKNLSPRDRTNQVNYLEFSAMVAGLTKGEKAITSIDSSVETPQIALSASKGMTRQVATNMYTEAMEQIEINKWLRSNQEDYMGFGFFRSLVMSYNPIDAIYYDKIVRARELVRKMRYTGDADTRAHYELLLHRLDGMLQ